MVEVEIIDIDPTTEMEKVEEALRSCLNEDLEAKLKVNMTRRPLKGTRKASIKLEESRALKMLKATYIRIEVVSCRHVGRWQSVNATGT